MIATDTLYHDALIKEGDVFEVMPSQVEHFEKLGHIQADGKAKLSDVIEARKEKQKIVPANKAATPTENKNKKKDK